MLNLRYADRPSPRVWRLAAIGVALLVVAWALQSFIHVDTDAVRQWLLDLGPVAPLAYVAVYATQVVVAPLPGLPIGAAAGFVFGLVPALIYGFVGLGIGVTVAIVAGRRFGLRLLARVAGPEAIARWERLRLINSPWTWLAIFLGPSPDLILFVAGMSRIPLRRLFVVALLGRAPAMVCATFLGAGLGDFGPWLLIGGALGGALFAAAGLLINRFVPVMAGPSAEATAS